LVQSDDGDVVDGWIAIGEMPVTQRNRDGSVAVDASSQICKQVGASNASDVHTSIVQQMGAVWAREHDARGEDGRRDVKGHNMALWPADLRVREMPVRDGRPMEAA
jgi:hypothetical protein